MKENVFDVLIYLFENYMDEEGSRSRPGRHPYRILEAGFPQEVNKAFEWLESLAEQQPIKTAS